MLALMPFAANISVIIAVALKLLSLICSLNFVQLMRIVCH